MLSPALTVAEVLDGDLHPDFRKISWNSVFRLTCSAQWLGLIQFWQEHRLSCTFLKGIRHSLWQDLMGTVWHHDSWLQLITQIIPNWAMELPWSFDMFWYGLMISGDDIRGRTAGAPANIFLQLPSPTSLRTWHWSGFEHAILQSCADFAILCSVLGVWIVYVITISYWSVGPYVVYYI